MKAWLKRVMKPKVRRTLNLPAPPTSGPMLLGPSPARGRAGQLAAYQGWVYAAVSAIASRVAGMELRLRRLEDHGPGQQVNRHPVLELLKRPNPIMTRRELKYTMTAHLELTGMAFLLVNQNALGLPAELWPLSPADLVEIQTSGSTGRPVTGFRFRAPGGQEVVHRPQDILYFRHPSPTSLVYGASPIEAVAHAYDIDLAVRVYQANFFKNAARPEVVLSTDSRLTEEEARRILTRWNQKHQGLAHVFEPTLLDAGLKATPMTFSAKDFEFMALAGWTQDNILAAYQVPAGKLGLVKDLNRANAFAVDVTFNAECVRPRLEMIEEVLSAFLLPRYGEGLVLKHDNPVPTDREQSHKEAMDRLDRGVLTINEVRADLGKGPVAWGDAPALAKRPTGAAPPPDNAAGIEKALKLYGRLEARFAGWSAARVKKELEARPELMDEIHGPGAESRRALLAQGLINGMTIEQMNAALAGPAKEDLR